jgi:cytochrome b561
MTTFISRQRDTAERMLQEIIYAAVFGLPFIVWVGIATLVGLLVTAAIAVLTMRGIYVIPVKWHVISARITIVLALLHVLMALFVYLP